MNESRRHVLLLHHEGNTFNNPSLKAIVELLLKEGYCCSVRHPKAGMALPRIENLASIPYGWFLGKFRRWIRDRLRARWLIRALVAAESRLLYGRPALTIAVDRPGLVEAAALKRLCGTPFVFASFEILFESETSPGFKQMERIEGSACDAWIVQDEARATALTRENSLDPSRGFILPLASEGRGDKVPTRLRDKLGIPADKRVAIMIGSLAAWTMATEILNSVDSWPSDWVLVVHERYGNTLAELHRMGIDAARLSSRIHFSTKAPASVDDMGYVLAGVSAGLAFYQPTYDTPYTGMNLELIGKAAGKIATYLRYGIPIVTNEIGAYAKDIRTYGIGAVASHPCELPVALATIGEGAATAALDYFDHQLDFSLRRDALSSLFESMVCADTNGSVGRLA